MPRWASRKPSFAPCAGISGISKPQKRGVKAKEAAFLVCQASSSPLTRFNEVLTMW